MKKISILCLCVSMMLVLSFAGCKKAEQPAETPKPSTQAQAPTTSMGFVVTGGTLEKGSIGYVFSADQDKTAVAMKKVDIPYKNIVTIKGQIKAAVPSGPRNGFIFFGENPKELAKALLLIGGKTLAIEGPFVQKVEKPQNFDQNKVFETELIINLNQKTVTWKVDKTEVKTQMTARPASINYIGFAVWQTKTEFSELQITGE